MRIEVPPQRPSHSMTQWRSVRIESFFKIADAGTDSGSGYEVPVTTCHHQLARGRSICEHAVIVRARAET